MDNKDRNLLYGESMFKKIVAVLLVGLMLNPGYAFAQTKDNSSSSPKNLQEQAREAYDKIKSSLKKMDEQFDAWGPMKSILYAL